MPQIGFLHVLILLVSRKQVKDVWSAESHEGRGTCVQSGCAAKKVNSQAQEEPQNQQLPIRNVDGQEHDENDIDVWMHITTQADIVDYKHLKKDECDKTNDIE